MLLGCIGDDFTGSSDLGNTLAKGGMRVTQYSGVPSKAASPDVDAGVIALKSRTIPPQDAVALSLQALEWLLEQGCEQIVFKYCSTFDSTPEGNIGPVIDALLNRLSTDRAIVCPSFPGAGRTVYQGHLFVWDRLLNESGMEHHPLTPMTDPDIRRWLKPQTNKKIGLVGLTSVLQGEEAIRSALEEQVLAGNAIVVVDAVRDDDLLQIGRASRDIRLVTGGSGVALGLPANFRSRGLLTDSLANWQGNSGPAAILAGSCSGMTRAQIGAHSEHSPTREVTAEELMQGRVTPADATSWIMDSNGDGVPLLYSSADPEVVKKAQQEYGRELAAATIENFFAETAQQLQKAGVSRLVVAGGETSGAVIEGLCIDSLEFGPEIAPGVPALKAGDRPLWLALKSGNFGSDDFFQEAVDVLGGSAR
jgi:uncharacterized protein YgbK (DUF1537 family)